MDSLQSEFAHIALRNSQFPDNAEALQAGFFLNFSSSCINWRLPGFNRPAGHLDTGFREVNMHE